MSVNTTQCIKTIRKFSHRSTYVYNIVYVVFYICKKKNIFFSPPSKFITRIRRLLRVPRICVSARVRLGGIFSSTVLFIHSGITSTTISVSVLHFPFVVGIAMIDCVCSLFDVKTAFFAAFLGALYLYATWTHDRWSKLGVPVPWTPVPLFGHAMPSILGRMHFMDVLHGLYKSLGDRRFGGIYTMRTPQLLIKDPELIGKTLFK